MAFGKAEFWEKKKKNITLHIWGILRKKNYKYEENGEWQNPTLSSYNNEKEPTQTKTNLSYQI